MDPTAFDTLVRSFATTGTRRGLLRLLAAVPVLGTLAVVGEEAVAAEHGNHRTSRRRTHHPQPTKAKKGQGKKGKGKGKHGKGHKGKGKGKNPRNRPPGPPPGTGPTPNPNPCLPNGTACTQSGQCCGGNCFNFVCATPVSQCATGGTSITCSPPGTGCCANDIDCCGGPDNQCNEAGLCCAPNCPVGVECGGDGCGGIGTCGSCPPGQECTEQGQCVCPAPCATTGCCDAQGRCQAGTANGACGAGGGSCQNCSAQGQACGGGGTPGVCGCASDATTCAGKCGFVQNNCGQFVNCTPLCGGCCDSNFVCQPGTGDFACGTGGAFCDDCLFHGHCVDGHCQCDADLCPTGCCSNGLGQPGFCEAGTTNKFCGTGGAQCQSCPSGTFCCNHVCQSALKPNGTACTQDNQCCVGNCFNGVCADRVTACGTEFCSPSAKGCAGNTCCFGQAFGCAGNETCCDHPCCGSVPELQTCCGTCQICSAQGNCQPATGTVCGTSTHGGTTLRCCNGACPDPDCIPIITPQDGDCNPGPCGDIGQNCCFPNHGVACLDGQCSCEVTPGPGQACGSDWDCQFAAGGASACICGTCQVPPS